jgi:hypothetical protein
VSLKEDENVNDKAYSDGVGDGNEWDLSGFDSVDDALKAGGWAEATINAVGSEACAKTWGVAEVGSAEWDEACEDYERGVLAAISGRR